MPEPTTNKPSNRERAAAVEILMEVTEDAAYANIALRRTLAKHPGMDARGKAFVTELVNTTLRNLLFIDYILDTFSNTPVQKMKPYIRAVLRMAVCQLRFMDRVPPSAAVDESVRLVKKRGFQALAGFVNAVLRTVVRQPDKPVIPAFAENAVLHLQLAYSYPAWLAEALIGWMGPERTLAFAAESHRPPSVTVFTNLLKISPESLMARLRVEGADCEPGALYPECLRLRRVSDLTQLPSFNKGLFHVMDEGAVTAVKALGPRSGARVIDLCAAPGGKTFALACYMGDTGQISAYDIQPNRINLLKETAERLGIHCIDVQTGDALQADPALIGTADAVLLDAPCSGLGILRKRPDIKYARKQEDIRTLADIQFKMLETASAYVKPGGVLVYCTCTVSREENIENIRRFTAEYPFEAEAPPEDLWMGTAGANPAFMLEEQCLQLWPGPDHDGFFIAKLVCRNLL